jgi:hypothetical protein
MSVDWSRRLVGLFSLVVGNGYINLDVSCQIFFLVILLAKLASGP